MNWTSLNRIAPLPPEYPVTVDQAKDHLRMDADSTVDDELVNRYIAAATDWVEKFTNRALCQQTWAMRLDDFPRCTGARGRYIELPKPPGISVASITYVDTAGVTQTLATDRYAVFADDWQPFVTEAYGTTWPSVRSQPGAVTVTFVAGYAKEGSSYRTNVPDALKAAIWMHVQGQYDNLPAADWQALERAIKNMVEPYRVRSI